MSSNILSEVYDVSRFGVIYAGAQKNIGPAGLTLVIVRKDLLGRARKDCPKILNWTVMDEKGSMLNTPPTYAIYMAGLCMKWLKKQGGVAAIEKVNIEKSSLLYALLDESAFYRPKAAPASRSRMNVTFTTPRRAISPTRSTPRAGGSPASASSPATWWWRCRTSPRPIAAA